jgi:hypothetical protein
MSATLEVDQGETTMFIAMNRFRVKKGSGDDFENVWLSRDSQLAKLFLGAMTIRSTLAPKAWHGAV